MITERKIAVITGVTGQDGSYLSRFLLEKGYKVFGFIRDTSLLNPRNLEYLGISDRIELIKANLLDLSNLIRLIDNTRPDEVYNLAAQSSVGLSFEQPLWTLEFNALSTANLLEAIRIAKPDTKFYQASSSEMFGNIKEENLPISEKTAIHPVSPYAISKATAHWITVNYREAYGIFACCGILFNHESVLRPIHFVTKKIINTAVKIKLGMVNELVLGNIDIYRDWGYAPRYVEAMWLMIQKRDADDYIISFGEPHSLREFLQVTFSELKLDPQRYIKIDNNLLRPADIKIIYGDSTKARKKLDWDYSLTFRELIRLLIDEEFFYVEKELK